MRVRLILLCSIGVVSQDPLEQRDYGVWRLVDVQSLVCTPGQGSTKVVIPLDGISPQDAHTPHILTFYRSTTNPVTIDYTATDSSSVLVAQGTVELEAAEALGEQGAMPAPEAMNEVEAEIANESQGSSLRRLSSRRRSGSSSYSPPRRRSYSPPRRRAYSPPRRRVVSPPRRRVYSPPRRRISSPPRRRVLSPRRRASYSPPRRRVSGLTPRRRMPLDDRRRSMTYPRRRSWVDSTSISRRRVANCGPGAQVVPPYYNTHYTSSGSYGYGCSGHMQANYGGYYPYQTPYGYTGASAWRPGFGTVALGLGGGLLGGYMLGSWMNSGHSYGGGYDGYGNDWISGCTAHGVPIPCNSCIVDPSCVAQINPPVDMTRDDLTSTGFYPADLTGPLNVVITRIVGPDFLSSVVCPPAGWEACVAEATSHANSTNNSTGNWAAVSHCSARRLVEYPPKKSFLFVSLTRMDEIVADASTEPGGSEGSGGPQGPQGSSSGLTSTVIAIVSSFMACCCLCCCCGVGALGFLGYQSSARSVSGSSSGSESFCGSSSGTDSNSFE